MNKSTIGHEKDGNQSEKHSASIRGEANQNFLDIDFADVERLESDIEARSCDVEVEKPRRIYGFALVLYELLSGGEKPPKVLFDLGSSAGAFVSLLTMTLVKEKDIGDSSSPAEPKHRQCPSGSLCQISHEYLRLISVHGPLCWLIFNMLDCVYGDMSGNETYQCIADVLYDLQLMLDHPKYLRGLNMETCPQLAELLAEI